MTHQPTVDNESVSTENAQKFISLHQSKSRRLYLVQHQQIFSECLELIFRKSEFRVTSYLGWFSHNVTVSGSFMISDFLSQSMQALLPHFWLSFGVTSSFEKEDFANKTDAVFAFLLSATISFVGAPKSLLMSSQWFLRISFTFVDKIWFLLTVKIICFSAF